MKKIVLLSLMVYLSLGMAPSGSASDLSDILKKNTYGKTLVKNSRIVDAIGPKEMPFYAPSYVKQNLIAPGVFETEGYITFVHNPYNGQMHQRLIIVHEQKNGPEDTAIRIKIKDAEGLQKGGHYRFIVKAENGNKPQQPLELVKFTPIK